MRDDDTVTDERTGEHHVIVGDSFPGRSWEKMTLQLTPASG